ncbi:MAG: Rieske 2Fe-2S domain-containing protein [Planctomycetota bacterium]
MAELDHWHPILLSGDLAEGAQVAAKLCGRELVVFRSAGGLCGALTDVCPHRGMRLSCGSVAGDRLVCPYHGWSFDRAGAGESPGTPKLFTTAESFDCRERHGAIWVRRRPADGAADTQIPELTFSGFHRVASFRHRIEAPLEVILDNFTEVEHTSTTHALLGYAAGSMRDVITKVTTTDATVRVFNEGPQKKIPWVFERLAGVYTGDRFVDDWTTHFSPVHTIYDQYWRSLRTDEVRDNRLKVAVFFNPRDAQTTELVTFAFTSLSPKGRLGINRWLMPIFARLIEHEIELDKAMVERMADKSPGLKGHKLGRFDKALGENRRRIETIYRGAKPQAAKAT